MQRFITAFLALTFSIAGTLTAGHYTFDVAGGYRGDHLRWDIAGPFGIPDVLSEVKYKRVRSYNVGAVGTYVNCHHWYFRGSGDYGRIYQGHQSESDFLGEDETLPFFLSSSDANKGEVYDYSGGIGYQFNFLINRFSFSPLVGYSHHAQHFHMTNLFVEFDPIFEIVGPIPGQHDTYNTRWTGPWFGADFNFRMTCDLWLFGTGEFHLVHYAAKGHTGRNLIPDFRQSANGYGQNYIVGINYKPFCNWGVGILGNYQHFWTRHGHSRPKGIDEIHVRLNRVHWTSWSLMGQLHIEF